jgi:hypothetical protein
MKGCFEIAACLMNSESIFAVQTVAEVVIGNLVAAKTYQNPLEHQKRLYCSQ